MTTTAEHLRQLAQDLHHAGFTEHDIQPLLQQALPQILRDHSLHTSPQS